MAPGMRLVMGWGGRRGVAAHPGPAVRVRRPSARLGTFGWCPRALLAVSIQTVQRLLAIPRRNDRPRSRSLSGRIHAPVFAGGLLFLVLGIAGWTLHGGPEIDRGRDPRPRPHHRRHDPVHGRPRRPGARRGGPPHGPAGRPAARRAPDERQPDQRGRGPGGGRGDAPGHRLPQRPGLPAPAPGRPGAGGVRGTRGRLREGGPGHPADEGRRGLHRLGGRAPDAAVRAPTSWPTRAG